MQRLLELSGSGLIYPDYRVGLQAILSGAGLTPAEAALSYKGEIIDPEEFTNYETENSINASPGVIDKNDINEKIKSLESLIKDLILRQDYLEVLFI
jgi:hypothetical protein